MGNRDSKLILAAGAFPDLFPICYNLNGLVRKRISGKGGERFVCDLRLAWRYGPYV